LRAGSGTLGVIGLILLFFGFTAWWLTGQIGLFVGANLVFGFFSVASYLAAGRERLTSFLGERSTKYGANAILYSALFVGIVAMANFLAVRYSRRIDTSEANVFSLSPQSTAVVKDLDKPLEVMAFLEGGSNALVDDLLKSYAYESDKVSYQIVDPDKRPELAEKFAIQNYNTVRVAYGDQSTIVDEPSEEKITNAIIKVTQAKKKTVCIVEGHGEPDAEDVENARSYGQLRAALANENYDVQKMLLATQEKPPSECSVLVVPAGEKPWLEPEIALFEKFLEEGGRAIVLFSARRPTQLAPILAKYGVQVGEDVVVDQVIRLFQGPALGVEPIANSYDQQHPITAKFTQRTIFPLARSAEVAESAPEGVTATSIVKSAASGWAETDLKGVFDNGQAVFDEGKDRKGPVSIAVAATVPKKGTGEATEGEAAPAGGESRIVVFGSDEFANNKNLQSFYNRDLVLNAVGWVAGEENLVSIRPRGLRSSRVQLTGNEMTTIFYLSVLGLPELLLLIGVVVSLRRRGA
jgi:ABC-type uncharacterized transport system involved in gliding motility auxiliary subunit